MAKAGRKRKAGVKREANGRASRAGEGEAMRVVALSQPHRACLPKDARRDHRAECALGRLFLRKVITEAEFEAGERLAAAKLAFSRALVSPVTIKSASGQMVAERVSSDDWERAERSISAGTESEEDRNERALGRWNMLEAVVWGAVACERERMAVVMRVVIEGCDLARDSSGYGVELDWLRAALGALARHLKLDARADETNAKQQRLRASVDGVEIKREKQRKAA